MFDFDTGKLVVIGVVALVVIGPKELPRVLRQVGQTVGKVRRMAGEFQAQFMEAMREAEMADVKEEMSKIADAAKINVAFDPVRDIRNQISGAIDGETTPNAATVYPEISDNSASLAQLESTPSPAADAAPTGNDLLDAGVARGTPVETAGDDDAAIEQTASTVDSDHVAKGVAPQPTPLPSALPGQHEEAAPHPAAHETAHVA